MIETGEELRDAGISQVEKNTPLDWRSSAQFAIANLAVAGKPFTAEDVRDLVGDPPNHSNAMGAQFMVACKAGMIRRIGYAKPRRASRHAGVIAEWIGTQEY